MKKVHVVGGDGLIERMFAKRDYEFVADPKNAELLCFTGGADVCPDIYRADHHPTTRFNRARDFEEKRVFDTYLGLPKVGICRGSQFLNVMSGGTLWQDVDNHAIGGTHQCFYLPSAHYAYDWREHYVPKDEDEGEVIRYNHPTETTSQEHEVTSTHHQMMRPDRNNSELWGFTWLSRHRDTGGQMHRRTNFEYSPDVEIVYYPGSKSLCFQPHPEYGVKSCEDLFFTCLQRAFPDAVVG